MLETNIRIVSPGPSLYVDVRHTSVSGNDVTPELAQKVCSMMRRRYGLAAVPVPGASGRALYVAAKRPLQPMRFKDRAWEVEVAESSDGATRLTLDTDEGRETIPELVERALFVTLSKTTKLWTLDCNRIWYQDRSYRAVDGISAYRRFELGSVVIDGEGLGISVDLGTAFLTSEDLSYFFPVTVVAGEQKRRAQWFAELVHRQEGQKGTLVYDNGRSRTKCYFEHPCEGLTCGSTERIRFDGKSFDTLLAYYQTEYPGLAISADDAVVAVSFPGIDRPQLVAAKQLRARISNESAPPSLSNVDKIEPDERRPVIDGFWRSLGDRPFGAVAPATCKEFWQPGTDRLLQLAPPALLFGSGQRLPGPSISTVSAYRDYYRRRTDFLDKHGCFNVPATLPRTIWCAYPSSVGSEPAEQLAGDVARLMSKWTAVKVDAHLVSYEDIEDAVSQLNSKNSSGLGVVILDGQPTSYHDVAFGLSNWRIHRVTKAELCRHYGFAQDGVWDRRSRTMDRSKGCFRWKSFVMLNALDLLQLADAVPFSYEASNAYEAHLVIDVGYDRRHFAVSLLIARDSRKNPDFRIATHVQAKHDHQHENVNAIVLRDAIVKLADETLRRPCDALSSMLMIRDGVSGRHEAAAVEEAVEQLVSLGKVQQGARVDFVELYKDTLKSLRMWEVEERDGRVTNPLEGRGVVLNRNMVLLASTGASTLSQGTAQPYLVVGNGHCSSVRDAAFATFEGSQLNWSSPSVAQRMHLAVKRTDEELKARAAQEIRRIR